MERTNRGFKATRSLLTFNFLILGKRDCDWPFFLPIAGLKLRPLGCLVPGEGKEDGLAGWLGQNIRRHLQKKWKKDTRYTNHKNIEEKIRNTLVSKWQL